MPYFHPDLTEMWVCFSNWAIRLGKERLGRSIVCAVSSMEVNFSLTGRTGALNWATGETVAVKEIQLSNIPKGELPEIMVSGMPQQHSTKIGPLDIHS